MGGAAENYLPTFDDARGVTALAVVGSHSENRSGINLHLQAAGAVLDFIRILSGFVIAQAYEQRPADGLGWRAHMRLRLARLYPAIWVGPWPAWPCWPGLARH